MLDAAATVALCRALATYEEREEIRGADNLADLFLAPDLKATIAQPTPRAYLRMQFAKYGTYEYFIARTAYIDSALTQQRKRSCLERAGVTAPPQLTYAPIEFTKESLADVLRAAAFDESRKTLFIWEGVTYYLPAEAIDRTLEFVRRHAPTGSVVCFDYLADAPDVLERYGVKESLAAMRAVYQNEPVQFRIQEGAIESFLSERGFSLAEHLRTQDMEQRFLTLRDGSLAGRVLACFRLVQASSQPL